MNIDTACSFSMTENAICQEQHKLAWGQKAADCCEKPDLQAAKV